MLEYNKTRKIRITKNKLIKLYNQYQDISKMARFLSTDIKTLTEKFKEFNINIT